MHAKKTWAVAAALAFASTAVADQGRPRIYFPRNIKRQALSVNTTEAEPSSTTASVTSGTALSSTYGESASGSPPPNTDDESASDASRPTNDDDDSPLAPLGPTPNESSSETPLPSTDEKSTSDPSVPSTDDESASDASKPTDDDDSLLDDLLPTPDKSTSERRSDSSASESPSGGLPDIDDILTLAFSSTVDVGSSASPLSTTTTKTSGGFPDIFVKPTLSDSEEEEESSSTEEETVPTTSDGIVVAPTGLLPGLGLTGLPDLDLGLGGKKSSETIGSDSSGLPNPTAPAAETESETETTKDLWPTPTWSKPTWINPTAPSDDAIPSVTDSKPSGTGLLDHILDPVASAIDDLSIPAPVNFSDPTAPAGTGAEPALTLLPTIPDPTAPNVPGLTGLPIPDLVNGSDPNTNPITQPGYTDPAGADPTGPPLSGGLDPPTNLTIPLPDPTAAPTGTAVLPPALNTSTPTTLIPGDYTTSSEEPVETLPPVQNTTIPEPEPTKPPVIHVTKIKPIATVSKENWLGTQLIADEATETVNTDAPAPTQSEALPEGMPNSIDANSDDVEQPDGTTLIRVVFDRRLHYEFVAQNFTATQQIFMYLPMVIGHGEGIEQTKTKMMRLEPIETKQKKGWVTTAAFAYVPDGIIDRLQMDIHLTNSELYNPPHPIARGIAAAIDPSYGIFPGSSDLEVSKDDSKEGGGGAPFSGGGSGSGEEQSSTQKGTTAGIAVGAVGAAVAYGAAMFLVARRYKRKKQSHRRSSSIGGGAGGPGPSHSPTSEMRYADTGSPATAMMGGAILSRDFSGGYGGVAGGSAGTAGGRTSQGSGQSGAGNSGRTAGFISAPVAAENSLGWN